MSFKKSYVVMLPTDQRADNLIYFSSNKLHTNICYPEMYSDNEVFNLYFLSDEGIKEKEGDWCLDLYTGSIFKKTNELSHYEINSNGKVKKIIASTDKSLGLPQPSKSFIKVYIKSYNEGKSITHVMVEYEFVAKDFTIKAFHEYHKENEGIDCLKVNPKDNTITIRKIKDSWNREEVIKLILDSPNDLSVHKWIEENLY